MLPGAPGIATKNKKLLGTPGPTTRSKKLLGAKTLPGAPGIDRGDSLRPLSAKAASRDSTVRRARAHRGSPAGPSPVLQLLQLLRWLSPCRTPQGYNQTSGVGTTSLWDPTTGTCREMWRSFADQGAKA